MSKSFILAGLLASIVLYDPPRVLGLLGPHAYVLGWKLQQALTPAWMARALRASR